MPYWWRPLRGLQLEGGRSVHKELEETDRGQGGEKESHSQVCSGGQESARAQVQLPWTPPPPPHTHRPAAEAMAPSQRASGPTALCIWGDPRRGNKWETS